MRLLFITTILTVAALQSAQASVMGVGQKSFRAEYSEGKSSEVFTGDGTKVDYKAIGALGGIDKRDSKNLTLGQSFGIGSNSQIDLGLIYSDVDATKATRGGIAEVSARYVYNAYSNENFDVNLGFGFRAAGDNKGGSNFQSLSDGLTKYDYSLDLGYSLGSFKLGLNSRYTDRNSDVSKPVTVFEAYGAYFPTSDVFVSLSYITLNTSGGTDVLAAGFDFSTLKEKYDAVALAAGYNIDQTYAVDARYAQKLSSNAKNTDANTTFGLGLTVNY